MSEAGAAHITKMLARRGKGVGIRVGVKTTGCSGLAYVLEYVDTPHATDTVFPFEGFSVFTDPKHLAYLDEMTIDFVRNGLNEGFEFQNPRERDRCGCGASFRI